jgi:hypothetical protein
VVRVDVGQRRLELEVEARLRPLELVVLETKDGTLWKTEKEE